MSLFLFMTLKIISVGITYNNNNNTNNLAPTNEELVLQPSSDLEVQMCFNC